METTEQRTQSRTALRSTPREPIAPEDAQARSASIRRQSIGLGWFSLGLGLAQLVAPRQMASWMGMDGKDPNVRLKLVACAVRELTCGLGLLSQSRTSTWAWVRALGDIVDLGLIGSAVRSGDTDRNKALGAAAVVLGVTALDASTAIGLHRSGHDLHVEGISIRESITICRAPREVYEFFRDFENLPTFMSHLESVHVDNGHSRWRVRGPLGSHIEWDAEIVEDRPGELLVWRSTSADVPNRGRVHFKPLRGRHESEQETELIVELNYDPPAGALGATLATLFGKEPSQQVSADLRRLKQVLETGEVLHSDASIHRGMHAARPSHRRLAEVTEVQP